MLRTHLSALETTASLYGAFPAFRILRRGSLAETLEWDTVSFSQFHSDVELFARHWARKLKNDDVPQRSVIGMWLSGMTYLDVLHIYGISRAGYVPQLFSINLPNPSVIAELLRKSDAKALIFDPSFESVVGDIPLPSHCCIDMSGVDPREEPLPVFPSVTGDDLVFIFHSSGSTSAGSPKLIRCNYTWLSAAINKSYQISKPFIDGKRDVTVWMGSMCHIGQEYMLIGSIQHGTCTIQPSKINFSSDELVTMAVKCGLNRINQFAPFLAVHIRRARDDPKLLAVLRSFDEILYSGHPLSWDEKEFCYQQGIKLKNVFGSTESGAMLLSLGGSDLRRAPLLRPCEGMSYRFSPVVLSANTPAASEGGFQTAASQLFELVVLAESGDCPHPSLRAEDGHYHTGDLFHEIEPGLYLFRGRNDDWIKSQNSLRCDTKAIEDNVRATCPELISECMVVGNGRPSPALFIEPSVSVDQKRLKQEVLRRTHQFHSRRYIHERITSADLIIVVEPNTLPRTATKGNIRRRAIEEEYRTVLDALYA